MSIKLEKLVEILQDTALKNEMINDFGYGEVSDIMNLKMPYIWIEPTGSVISGGLMNEISFQFDVFVMDRLIKGDVENWLETTSDTLYILHTFINQLSKTDDFISLGLLLQQNITTEPVYESTDDDVNGHKATILIKTPSRIAPCNSPLN